MDRGRSIRTWPWPSPSAVPQLAVFLGQPDKFAVLVEHVRSGARISHPIFRRGVVLPRPPTPPFLIRPVVAASYMSRRSLSASIASVHSRADNSSTLRHALVGVTDIGYSAGDLSAKAESFERRIDHRLKWL